jgi:hypothetical protein
LAIVAIVAVGLLGVIVIEGISIPQQQAQAAPSITGQCASTIKNASAPGCPKG